MHVVPPIVHAEPLGAFWLAHAPALHTLSTHSLGSAHSVPGSVPASMFAQVPFGEGVIAAAQAWQRPLQAVLQQKPSTQNPSAHSFPFWQG